MPPSIKTFYFNHHRLDKSRILISVIILLVILPVFAFLNPNSVLCYSIKNCVHQINAKLPTHQFKCSLFILFILTFQVIRVENPEPREDLSAHNVLIHWLINSQDSEQNALKQRHYECYVKQKLSYIFSEPVMTTLIHFVYIV